MAPTAGNFLILFICSAVTAYGRVSHTHPQRRARFRGEGHARRLESVTKVSLRGVTDNTPCKSCAPAAVFATNTELEAAVPEEAIKVHLCSQMDGDFQKKPKKGKRRPATKKRR